MSSGSYFYPGTDVLRNRPGIKDLGRLRKFEEQVTRLRMSEALHLRPVEGNFDRKYMQEIHRQILGDVYEWAGELRTWPLFPAQMVKSGPSPSSIALGRYDADDQYPYCYFPAGDGMVAHFDQWCHALSANEHLPQASSSEFAAFIAEP